MGYNDESDLRCQNAACYCTQEDEDTEMGMDEDLSPPPSGKPPGPSSCAGGLPPCFGRNMTFPRGPSSAYTVRHELPAVVTEGDAYRGHGEVRIIQKLIKMLNINISFGSHEYRHSSAQKLNLLKDHLFRNHCLVCIGYALQ